MYISTDPPAPEDLTKTDPCPWLGPVPRGGDEDTLVSRRDPYQGPESDDTVLPPPPLLPREYRGWRGWLRETTATMLRRVAARLAGDEAAARW